MPTHSQEVNAKKRRRHASLGMTGLVCARKNQQRREFSRDTFANQRLVLEVSVGMTVV
jgi:hypothetical protein